MSDVFIDTFELTYKTDFDTMITMTRKFKMFKIDRKDEYICTELAGMGFIIRSKKCSKFECNGTRNKYKVIIRVDPNRLQNGHTNTEHIYDLEEFSAKLSYLEKLISFWFQPKEINLNSFKLTRIDITKDIHGVPENIIQEYIKIMRRMQLYCGYELNRELEENTDNFRKEDSFNVVNSSKKIEFVVYNKHRATIDQKYPDADKDFYKDTIRIEARCSKKFIKKHTGKMHTSDVLMYIFKNRSKILKDIYDSVFMYYTKTCFMQNYWQDKLIKINYSTKSRKTEKMLWLTNLMSSKMNYTLEEVLDSTDRSDDAKKNLLVYFKILGISPIPVQNKDIPFMQSIDSILEFDLPTEADKKYSRYLQRHTRGKEVFFHEQI